MIPYIPDLVELVYALGWAASMRPLTGHFAWRGADYYGRDNVNRGDWIIGGAQAAAVATIWPVIPVALAGKSLGPRIDKHIPKIGAEKAALKRQETDKVKQLEKELDLR